MSITQSTQYPWTPQERQAYLKSTEEAIERLKVSIAEDKKVAAMTPWQRWLYKTFNIEPKLKNRSR